MTQRWSQHLVIWFDSSGLYVEVSLGKILAVSQFRVCILRGTWYLWSSKASPPERLCQPCQPLLNGRSSLWSISWLCHQMFYPYVTISAAQARESDYL